MVIEATASNLSATEKVLWKAWDDSEKLYLFALDINNCCESMLIQSASNNRDIVFRDNLAITPAVLLKALNLL